MAEQSINVTSSKVAKTEFEYPYSVPYNSGFLITWDNPALNQPHRIFYQEHGNPQGEPVLFIHGGPGGGATEAAEVLTRFFDPDRYRVILFDQRGCGKSEPSVSVDVKAGLTNNTTNHLVSDIVALRKELGIKGKMHLFGGSWGSTLAMETAIQHPEIVQTLILRGIFLGRPCDVKVLYEGPDSSEVKDVSKPPVLGTYVTHPEAWKQFVDVIAPQDRHNMVEAYAKIFNAEPRTEQERAHQITAVRAWSTYEFNVSYLSQSLQTPDSLSESDAKKAIDMGRIEMHYFLNKMFYKSNNPILENIGVIAKADIPVHIVQGRYDVVCPPFQAENLVSALSAQGKPPASYVLTMSGHSALCRGNFNALKQTMDNLPRMTAYDLGHTPQALDRGHTPKGPTAAG